MQARVRKREDMGIGEESGPVVVHWTSTAGTAGHVQVRVKQREDIGREVPSAK